MAIPFPPELEEKYRGATLLGEGGMGVVFRAVQHPLGRDVAIKFLSLSLADREAAERFEQEARLGSQLIHPNVVVLFDYGTAGGAPYMVFEFVDGSTLRSLLNAGALPLPDALGIVRQALLGLAAAHGRGIVHRDIKPENILITSSGEVKLADFGIAKAGSSKGPKTQQGLLMGTPAYMSPEQAQEQPATPASDIYSMGCVLYELASGRVPFCASTVMETLRLHLLEPPPPLPQLPEPVRGVINCALAKSPASRFPTAESFIEHIDEVFPHASASGTLVIRAGDLPRSDSEMPYGHTRGFAGSGRTTQGIPGHDTPPSTPGAVAGSRPVIVPTLAPPPEEGGGLLGLVLVLTVSLLGGGYIFLELTRPKPVGGTGEITAGSPAPRSAGRGFARTREAGLVLRSGITGKVRELEAKVLRTLREPDGNTRAAAFLESRAARILDGKDVLSEQPIDTALVLLLTGKEPESRDRFVHGVLPELRDGAYESTLLMVNLYLELLTLHHLASPGSAVALELEQGRGSPLAALLQGAIHLREDRPGPAAVSFARFTGQALNVTPAMVLVQEAGARGRVASPGWFFLGLSLILSAPREPVLGKVTGEGLQSLRVYDAELHEFPCGDVAARLLLVAQGTAPPGPAGPAPATAARVLAPIQRAAEEILGKRPVTPPGTAHQ